MAEVRTTSSTGGQKGVKEERFGLLPRRGLEAIARVFGFGAQKYADHNWRRGYEWSKSIDALERHIQAFKDGETYDEESGLPHLGHAGFHVLVLLTWLHEQGEGADNPFDDRWPAGMERARRESAAEEEERLLGEDDDLVRRADEAWIIPTSPVQGFKQADLHPIIEAVNKALRNMAISMGTVGDPVEAGFQKPEVEWGDPAPRTFEATREGLVIHHTTEGSGLFDSNIFAVRRHPAYDDSWLPPDTGVVENFGPDLLSKRPPTTRWDRG